VISEKQIGLVARMYIEDNQGWILQHAQANATGTVSRRWYRVLYDKGYAKNIKVFYCPSLKGCNFNPSSTANADNQIGYGWNYYTVDSYGGGPGGASPEGYRNISQVSQRGMGAYGIEFFILAADTHIGRSNSPGWTSSYRIVPVAPDAATNYLPYPNRHSINVLFLDGHVENTKVDVIYNSADWNTYDYNWGPVLVKYWRCW